MNSQSLRSIFGKEPDSVGLVMSVPAAGAVWFITWWAALWLQNEAVPGNAPAPANYVLFLDAWDDAWALIVIIDVVILPILCGLLVYGLLRHYLAAWPVYLSSLLMGALIGGLGVMLIQLDRPGALGFLGYGLAGALASYLSLIAKSAWPGMVVQASFAYLNLRFYDNLLRYAGILDDFSLSAPDPLTSTRWLSSVLIAAFVLIVAVQVSRIRYGIGLTPANGDVTASTTKNPKSKRKM